MSLPREAQASNAKETLDNQLIVRPACDIKSRRREDLLKVESHWFACELTNHVKNKMQPVWRMRTAPLAITWGWIGLLLITTCGLVSINIGLDGIIKRLEPGSMVHWSHVSSHQ